MNPDQATKRSHPDQDGAEGEQESKGKAHDCAMGYDCVMSDTADRWHHAVAAAVSASTLLGGD